MFCDAEEIHSMIADSSEDMNNFIRKVHITNLACQDEN